MVDRWTLRTTAPELARRYLAEGLWSDTSLGSLLEQHLSRIPSEAVRVWSRKRPYDGSVAEVHRLARHLAGGLRRRGIGPGDVVAFQLPNCMEAVATFWGLSMLGAVLVPVVHFYGPKELGFILSQSGARALITGDGWGHLDYLEGLEALRPGLDDLELTVVVGLSGDGDRRPRGCLGWPDLLEAPPLEAPADVDPDAPAVIAYTSGTTSAPKGVIHSHRSLGGELSQMTQGWPPEDRPSLMGAPVGHAIGMLGGLLGPIVRGRSIHLTDGWDPSYVISVLEEGNLVFGGGATYFLTSLLDAPEWGPRTLERVRFTGLGGSPVPAAVGERASALGISIIRSYGSTEHPSITGATHDEPETKRIYTDGHPLAGVEIRLLDPDGRPVGTGEPGIIHSRGPELFVGYTDAELTAQAVDSEGWYRTGDVGVLDGDGYLTITDRTQDIIIRGGENISAGEVEELLVRMPQVAEAAVVAAPDARLGEHACAFLRLTPGSPAPDLTGVRSHLEKAGLARQKWPEELRVVDDFPRTASSKIKKFVLRDELRRTVQE